MMMEAFLSSIKDQVTCFVCFDLYEDPRALEPCRHIICCACYQRLYADSVPVRCPVCQLECSLPADQLKKDSRCEDLVGTYRASLMTQEASQSQEASVAQSSCSGACEMPGCQVSSAGFGPCSQLRLCSRHLGQDDKKLEELRAQVLREIDVRLEAGSSENLEIEVAEAVSLREAITESLSELEKEIRTKRENMEDALETRAERLQRRLDESRQQRGYLESSREQLISSEDPKMTFSLTQRVQLVLASSDPLAEDLGGSLHASAAPSSLKEAVRKSLDDFNLTPVVQGSVEPVAASRKRPYPFIDVASSPETAVDEDFTAPNPLSVDDSSEIDFHCGHTEADESSDDEVVAESDRELISDSDDDVVIDSPITAQDSDSDSSDTSSSVDDHPCLNQTENADNNVNYFDASDSSDSSDSDF